MEKNSLENIMTSTMENLNRMIDVNKVIGQAVMSPEGTTVIPVSSLSFGFVSGGGEYEVSASKKEVDHFPFAGGSGAGVSVKPTGFLVISKNNIRFLPVKQSSGCDKIVDAVPDVINMLKGAFEKENDDGYTEED